METIIALIDGAVLVGAIYVSANKPIEPRKQLVRAYERTIK